MKWIRHWRIAFIIGIIVAAVLLTSGCINPNKAATFCMENDYDGLDSEKIIGVFETHYYCYRAENNTIEKRYIEVVNNEIYFREIE